VLSAARVFAIYDVEHDGDLYERLVAESGNSGLDIAVSGGSESFSSTGAWDERTRRRIRAAERILVICGEQTEESMGAAAELRIAREERKPILLLWGRRELMCTKPVGAKPTEGMYTWTSATLQEQFALMGRIAQREAAADEMRRDPKPRGDTHAPAS
jgi:hypothetical protein